jgi:hypothetical protein
VAFSPGVRFRGVADHHREHLVYRFGAARLGEREIAFDRGLARLPRDPAGADQHATSAAAVAAVAQR